MLTGAWTAGVWWLNEQPLRMPWGFFAYAHADVLMLRLASSTLTFWGVEALILLTMLTVSELAASLIMNKRMSRLALCVFIGVLMVLTSVTRMHPSLTLPEPYEEKLTPILVQGNVTIEAEHQPRFNVKTTYQPMLAEAAKHMSLKPHTHALAVFPEGIEVYSPQGSTTLCGKAPCPMPLVAGGVVWRPDPVSGQLAVYNAVLAYAQGHAKAAGAIDKRPLVAFGEKIPFVRRGWLSSLMKHWGIEYGESFSEGSSGQAPITIVLDKHHTLRVGGLICFEALYPTIVRQYQHHGANILVTVGNLGWFHHHPMIEPQFIRFNQWRAAESATPLVLVTNTGTSAVIDNQGTIRFRLPSGQRRIERGPTLMIRD
jgi:apolipoprotein N-acyltransferase